MKRLLLFLLLFAVACTKITPEQELSAWLSTRAEEPLAGTIWEHKTTEDYNRYLYFSRSDVSLFYGKTEDGELHRWSEFFTAPYTFQGRLIRTSLSYRLWGHTEVTETASVVEGDGYTIHLDDDVYEYFGTDVGDIFIGEWMTIRVDIAPWE